MPLRGGLYFNLDVIFSPFLTQGLFLEVATKILSQGRGRGGGGYSGRGGKSRYGGRRGRRGYNRGRDERPLAISELNQRDIY